MTQELVKLQAGNALAGADDVVSNVATNQAELDARNNVDGKDIFPQSVVTQHLTANDGTIHGLLKSGTMLVGPGGITVTSEADGGTPDTGISITGSVITLVKTGVAQVILDGTDGSATFTGEVIATSGSFPLSLATGALFVGSGGVTITTDSGGGEPSGAGLFFGYESGGKPVFYMKNAAGVRTVDLDGSDGSATFKGTITASTISSMSSVNFGTNITVDGNITLKSTAISGYIYWGTVHLGYDGVSAIYSSADFLVAGALISSGLEVTGQGTVDGVDDAQHFTLNLGSTGGINISKFIIQDNGTDKFTFDPSTPLVTLSSPLTISGALSGVSAITLGSVNILTGTGAPAAGLGATGSLYCSDGGSLYFKQSGGWKRIDDWLT